MIFVKRLRQGCLKTEKLVNMSAVYSHVQTNYLGNIEELSCDGNPLVPEHKTGFWATLLVWPSQWSWPVKRRSSKVICRARGWGVLQNQSCTPTTVDERNPAPPGMYKTLWILGYLLHQLVQDFFHQQYFGETFMCFLIPVPDAALMPAIAPALRTATNASIEAAQVSRGERNQRPKIILPCYGGKDIFWK